MSEYCCRLNEECIVAIVRNRIGVDFGEIDYTIRCERFDNQDRKSLLEMISTMRILINKCQDRIDELDKGEY